MHKVGKFIIWLQGNLWYSVVIVTLAVLSIVLLAYELFYPGATPESKHVSRGIDLVIAYIFLSDFFLGFFFTKTFKGKTRYFKDNWLNLASSVPISSDVVRVFRLLRIFRALRVIRAIMNFRFAHKRHRRNATSQNSNNRSL